MALVKSALNFSFYVVCRYITYCSLHYLLNFCKTTLSLNNLVFMESGPKIGFWNINGLLEGKMSDEAFKGEINKYDILFLCETQLRRENINNLRHPDEYLRNIVFRKKRRKKGRSSGGFQFTFTMNSKKQYPCLINQMKIYSGSKLGKIC